MVPQELVSFYVPAAVIYSNIICSEDCVEILNLSVKENRI